MIVFGAVTPASVQDSCPSVPQEVELIQRIQAGEKDLLPELLAPYLSRIKALAMVILRDPAEAEDVMQDTILKVMLHLKSVRSSDCFSHWLLQVARNAARTRIRRDRKHLFEPLEPHPADDDFTATAHSIAADSRHDPFVSVEQVELRRALHHAVGTLQSTYREVWELSASGDFCIAEVARQLGITEANAMSRLRRARSKLRELLAPVVRECAACHRPAEESALQRRSTRCRTVLTPCFLPQQRSVKRSGLSESGTMAFSNPDKSDLIG